MDKLVIQDNSNQINLDSDLHVKKEKEKEKESNYSNSLIDINKNTNFNDVHLNYQYFPSLDPYNFNVNEFYKLTKVQQEDWVNYDYCLLIPYECPSETAQSFIKKVKNSLAEFVTLNHFNQEMTDILNFVLTYEKELEIVDYLTFVNIPKIFKNSTTFAQCTSVPDLRATMSSVNYKLVDMYFEFNLKAVNKSFLNTFPSKISEMSNVEKRWLIVVYIFSERLINIKVNSKYKSNNSDFNLTNKYSGKSRKDENQYNNNQLDFEDFDGNNNFNTLKDINIQLNKSDSHKNTNGQEEHQEQLKDGFNIENSSILKFDKLKDQYDIQNEFPDKKNNPNNVIKLPNMPNMQDIKNLNKNILNKPKQKLNVNPRPSNSNTVVRNAFVRYYEIPMCYNCRWYMHVVDIINTNNFVAAARGSYLIFKLLSEILHNHLGLTIPQTAMDDIKLSLTADVNIPTTNTILLGRERFFIILYTIDQPNCISLSSKNKLQIQIKEKEYKVFLYEKESIPIRDYQDYVFGMSNQKWFEKRYYEECTKSRREQYKFNGMYLQQNYIASVDFLKDYNIIKMGQLYNPFNQSDRLIILNHHLSQHFNLDRLINTGLVYDKFCLHFQPERTILDLRYGRVFSYLMRDISFQELTDIKDYYGYGLPFYLNYLSSFTKSIWHNMFYFVILGSVYIGMYSDIKLVKEQASLYKYLYTISVILMIYFNYHVSKKYKMDLTDLSIKWGVDKLLLDKDNIEQIKPEFRGTPKISKITGLVVYRSDKDYKYWLSRLLNWLILLCFLVVTYMTSFITLKISNWIEYPAAYGMLQAVSIKILNFLYLMVTRYTIEFENHRTYEEQKKSYFYKLMIFTFFNSYYAIFQIAINTTYEANLLCNPEPFNGNCWYYLGYQLSVLYSTTFAINLVMIVVPYLFCIVSLWRRFMHGGSLFELEEQPKEPEPGYYQCVRSDYYKLGVQELDMYILNTIVENGYMMLFGSTMPICWLILYLNHLLELKIVIRDHSKYYRRIEPIVRVGLGFWESIIDVMMFVSCIVNYSLLCFVQNSSDSKAPNNYSVLIQEFLFKFGIQLNSNVVSILMFVVIQNLFMIIIIIANTNSVKINKISELIQERATYVIKNLEEIK